MPAPVLLSLNMKGGVGKTTLAAHVPREIFTSRLKSVLLVDLDPQFNMSQQLLKESVYNSLITQSKSVMRLFEPAPVSDFFDVNTANLEPPSPSLVAYALYHLANAPSKHLSIIAGNFELTKYSFITDSGKLAHAKDFFLRSVSRARSEYDLIVIDMNPSSSFLTLCGLAAATDVVAPVRPDKFSVRGLDLVRRLMMHPAVGSTPKLHIVMNGVGRTAGMTDTEKDIRSAEFFKDCMLTNRLFQSGVLTARSDFTGFASDRRVSNRRQVSKDLRAVGLEICGRIGL